MSPFNVDSKAQLFVDRVLVGQTRDVGFTLHPAEKHPSNPIVRADRPWEGWRLEIYGNVVYDPDKKVFKMWYLGECRDHFALEYPSPYAVSADGVQWEKPEVGTLSVVEGDPLKHNVVTLRDLFCILCLGSLSFSIRNSTHANSHPGPTS